MIQVHIFISGYVHSVGFRRFIQREAMRRSLTGWVRNLSDRRVETVIQGEKETLDEMVLLARQGPMMAEVKSVNVIWEETTDTLRGFILLPTK